MNRAIEDKQYVCEVFIPECADNEYKRYIYEGLQHQFGKQVFNIMQQSRLPAVIDFKEETIPMYNPYEPGEKVRLTLLINPVDHHHITLTHFESTNLELVRDATKELKRRVMSKIKGLFRKSKFVR